MDSSTNSAGTTPLPGENSSNAQDATTPQTPLLDLIARRTRATPYRREWKKITGSLHASIFLEQLIWLWRKSGRKTFSKFVSPCSHPEYRPGSSWHEELDFSRREFEGAVRAIGTKITAGKSKRAARQNNILIYWTDSSRRTHWELNAALLEARLEAVTEDSDALARTLLRKSTGRTLPNKSTSSAVLKDAPTQTTDSASSRGKSNGRQPQKTHDLETPVLEDALDESRSSLSSSPETRDSDDRRGSQEVTTLPGAGESSGVNSKNLKSQEQKPAPRQGKRGSVSSTASSAKALAVKATELSPAARETLEAALGRQTELKGAANVPHTRRKLLALLGADETAWIALLSHSTLTARTCVASFAETHAKRPAGAGKSLADAASAKKREINRSGSYSRRGVFVEDGAPRHPPREPERYTQFGVLIEDGMRIHRDDLHLLDVRIDDDDIWYVLRYDERSDDKFGDPRVARRDKIRIHIGLDERDEERARRREGRVLFEHAASEESTA